jgi:hypothetical protein
MVLVTTKVWVEGFQLERTVRVRKDWVRRDVVRAVRATLPAGTLFQLGYLFKVTSIS